MKRLAILVILTGLTSAGVLATRHAEPLKNERLFSFPLQLGRWSGQEVPMENWVFVALETRYAIMRNYRSPEGGAVNLAITWYDDREVAFHAPEACLGGVGNTIKEKNEEVVRMGEQNSITVGRLLGVNGSNEMLVWYMFLNDGYVTPSQTEVRMRVLFERMKFKRTSTAFVRLIVSVTKGEEQARETLLNFLKVAFPELIEFTRTKNGVTNKSNE